MPRYTPRKHPVIATMMWRQQMAEAFGLPNMIGSGRKLGYSRYCSDSDSEFFRGRRDPWHRSRDAQA